MHFHEYLTENILLSIYKNQKIIAAYFQKHTTAPCFKKNSATFILMYSKKYISYSALEY